MLKRRKNCFPVQVDSQQFDVSYPTVFYPTPIPPRVTKRTGKHIWKKNPKIVNFWKQKTYRILNGLKTYTIDYKSGKYELKNLVISENVLCSRDENVPAFLRIIISSNLPVTPQVFISFCKSYSRVTYNLYD